MVDLDPKEKEKEARVREEKDSDLSTKKDQPPPEHNQLPNAWSVARLAIGALSALTIQNLPVDHHPPPRRRRQRKAMSTWLKRPSTLPSPLRLRTSLWLPRPMSISRHLNRCMASWTTVPAVFWLVTTLWWAYFIVFTYTTTMWLPWSSDQRCSSTA